MNTTQSPQTDHDTTNRSPSWRRPALLVTSLALLGSACGGRAPGPTAAAAAVEPISTVTSPVDGTVSIAMSIGDLYLVSLGSFEVTDGAEVLGCSRGSFIDDEHDDGSHTSVLTCLAGQRSGTFEVKSERQATGFTATPARPEYFVGPWTVAAGTGDFQQLRGGGDLVGSQLFPVLTVDTTYFGQIDFSG